MRLLLDAFLRKMPLCCIDYKSCFILNSCSVAHQVCSVCALDIVSYLFNNPLAHSSQFVNWDPLNLINLLSFFSPIHRASLSSFSSTWSRSLMKTNWRFGSFSFPALTPLVLWASLHTNPHSSESSLPPACSCSCAAWATWTSTTGGSTLFTRTATVPTTRSYSGSGR